LDRNEIDITEILNSNHTAVNQQIHSAGNNSGCTASTTDVSQDFHVYQLVWAAGSLEWKIDGTSTCKLANSIPSNPMFLIINTAMGGAGGSINNSTLPQSTSVDYVKITQP
jgi:beta-glucanase (GH16 family)